MFLIRERLQIKEPLIFLKDVTRRKLKKKVFSGASMQ